MVKASSAPDTTTALVYPLESTPGVGQALQIAPGVLWLRMPLPMTLNHINLWALEDEDGWTLVDTGMQTTEIAAAWGDVMPSHNEPFRGLHARLEQLIQGHERSLSRLLESLATPKTAVQVFGILFRRPVNSSVLDMASGESIAHLNCLVHRGQVVKHMDNAGVAWYRSN